MLSFTIEQWAVVALVFVAGWLLGLASHGGGRKWRERYAAEREAHAQNRKAAEQRVAALQHVPLLLGAAHLLGAVAVVAHVGGELSALSLATIVLPILIALGCDAAAYFLLRLRERFG